MPGISGPQRARRLTLSLADPTSAERPGKRPRRPPRSTRKAGTAPSASARRAQAAIRPRAKVLDELVDDRVAVEAAAIGDRADDAALACDKLSHRLVDRARGEQVPRSDRVALADAVQAVLRLVVHRRRPLQLEERDI